MIAPSEWVRPTVSSAVISRCGHYRYILTRPGHVDHSDEPPAVFCMLNPSTADAVRDDKTISMCRGFSKRWGKNGIVVVNLFAWRSTSPSELDEAKDPIGPDNDAWIQRIAGMSKDVVCAWGNNQHTDRITQVMNLFRRLKIRCQCLGTTVNGSPRHPSRLSYQTKLVRFAGSA